MLLYLKASNVGIFLLEVTPEVKNWIEIVTCTCGSEQIELRLAVAEILVSITSFFLTNQKLLLGM